MKQPPLSSGREAGLTRRELLSLGAAALLPFGQDGPDNLTVAGDPLDPPWGLVRPEYERTLSRALLVFPSEPITPEMVLAGRDRRGSVPTAFVTAAFHDIVEALPSYTELKLVARSVQRDAALSLLRMAGDRPAELHLVTERGVEVELWAQDLGEPVFRDGKPKFLVSGRIPEVSGPTSKMMRDRRRVAEFLFGRDSVLEAPFVFEGGNLAFDVVDAKLRVFVGRNAVQRTIDSLADDGRRASRATVHERIRSTFGAAEVVEMGRDRQLPLLQHIDQSFLILGEGLAVAPRPTEDVRREEKRQLEDHAAQLRELGYELLFIDHTGEDIAGWRNSVNAVPFVDRTNGGRRVLFPVFPGEAAGEGERPERTGLRGKAARAFDVYREAGYEPIPVRDLTHVAGGNTHCILNVLA